MLCACVTAPCLTLTRGYRSPPWLPLLHPTPPHTGPRLPLPLSFACPLLQLASSFKDGGRVEESIAVYRAALRLISRTGDVGNGGGGTITRASGGGGNWNSGMTTGRRRSSGSNPTINDTSSRSSSNGNAYYKRYGGGGTSGIGSASCLILPHAPSGSTDGSPTLALSTASASPYTQLASDAWCNLIHARMLLCDWRTRHSDFRALNVLLRRLLRASLCDRPGVADVDSVFSSDGDDRHGDDDDSGDLHVPGAAAANVQPKPLHQKQKHLPGTIVPAVQPFHSLVYPMTLAQMQVRGCVLVCRMMMFSLPLSRSAFGSSILCLVLLLLYLRPNRAFDHESTTATAILYSTLPVAAPGPGLRFPCIPHRQDAASAALPSPTAAAMGAETAT